MPAEDKAQSFEVSEYSEPEVGPNEMYKVIRQILVDHKMSATSHGTWGDMSGDLFKLHFHSFEMKLPTRMKEVEDRANSTFREITKLIKSEFKKRTKKTLKMVERKDLADYSIQKVSLNERYYAIFWRFYELSIS